MSKMKKIFLSVLILMSFCIVAGAAFAAGKPVDFFNIFIFNPLEERFGKTWAPVILVIISGIIGFFIKGTLPVIKKLLASIPKLLSKFFNGFKIKDYNKWVISENKEMSVGYKKVKINVKTDYVSLNVIEKTGINEKRMKSSDAFEKNQYLVIRGEPGSGKTTLLKHFAVKCASDPQKINKIYGKELIPVFISLKDAAHSNGLIDYVTEKFGRFFKNSKEYIDKKLKDGKFILLLDGIDEAEEHREKLMKWIEDFRSDYPKNRIAITLRIQGYENISFHEKFTEAEVSELNKSQMENLAENIIRENYADKNEDKEYLKQEVKNFMDQVSEKNKSLFLLAKNPMLMSIITLMYCEREYLPKTKIELYNECIKLMLKERDEKRNIKNRLKYDLEVKKSFLKKTAFYFIKINENIFDKSVLMERLRAISSEIGLAVTETDAFLEELIKSGILRNLSDITEKIDFAHKTFLEYFAALEIYDNRFEKEKLIYEHADASNWREVILLYAGLLPQPDNLIGNLIDKNYLSLAGECSIHARILSIPLREKIVKALFSSIVGKKDSKEKSSRIFSEMFLYEPDNFKFFFKEFIEKPDFVKFLKFLINNPLEKSEIKKMIYLSVLKLEEKKAAVIAEKFNMVYIPEGNCIIGEGKHLREIYIDSFLIDKYPVTNADYALFINAGGYENSDYWSKEGRNFISKKKIKEPRFWQDEKYNEPSHPVVGVSWYEAEAYAEWAGKRLSSELEWEKAARGTDGRKYPWGEKEPDKTLCNFNGNEGATTPVDKYEKGISPYGVYDMSGNVWEWCRGRYDKEERNVLRGGSWIDVDPNYFRCAYRDYYYPLCRFSYVGFRCVRT